MHCETCGADLEGPPPSPAAPAAGWRSLAGSVLAVCGVATQIAGAVLGNLVYVGVGYFACSMAFRLARAEQSLLEDDEIAPGPGTLPVATRIAKLVGVAGMAVGIPLALAALWRGSLVLR